MVKKYSELKMIQYKYAILCRCSTPARNSTSLKITLLFFENYVRDSKFKVKRQDFSKICPWTIFKTLVQKFSFYQLLKIPS